VKSPLCVATPAMEIKRSLTRKVKRTTDN